MASGKEFISLVPPKEQQPHSDFNNAPAALHSMVRDQMTITSWLCLGAVLQGVLFLVIGRLALVPAALYMLHRIFITYAQTVGWMKNPYMDGVLMKKFAAQFPDAAGNYPSKPAESGIVCFLIGARCNHPLGMFGPNYKQMGEFFDGMSKELEARADEFDFLGETQWLNAGDRTTSSEQMVVCYFRTVEGLHKYAHGDTHRKAWDWWNRDVGKMPHISIFHEVYHAPKGNWESIYVNSHLGGINSTTSRFTDPETGKVMWASPVVDASRGLLRTSAGRMSRSEAGEHEKMGVKDPYANY